MPRIKRIPIHPGEIQSTGIYFSKENSRRIQKVLRLSPGDTIEVFDDNQRFLVLLQPPDKSLAKGKVIETLGKPDGPDYRLTLVFALVRPGPVEQIFRHCTELGVTQFVPLITERSVPKPPGPKDRWRTIILEAVAQCERPDIPIIEDVQSLDDYLKNRVPQGIELILSTESDQPRMSELLKAANNAELSILVGPEGGFTRQEERTAISMGFKSAGLGPYKLRSETASMAACSLARCFHYL